MYIAIGKQTKTYNYTPGPWANFSITPLAAWPMRKYLFLPLYGKRISFYLPRSMREYLYYTTGLNKVALITPCPVSKYL